MLDNCASIRYIAGGTRYRILKGRNVHWQTESHLELVARGTATTIITIHISTLLISSTNSFFFEFVFAPTLSLSRFLRTQTEQMGKRKIAYPLLDMMAEY